MATNFQPGDAVGVDATHKALATVMQRCASAGIDNYVLDPAIGLWVPQRSPDDDWELSRRFDEFLRYDHPLLAAVSRKSFIGNLLDKDPQERLSGSLAVTMTLLEKGAAMVRTHDVRETVDTVRVFERLVKRR
jgi:dihydropteroate synthase